MVFQVVDRVWDTTSTTGTGSVTLNNTPPNAYQSFATVCNNGDIIHYVLQGRTANVWEVGLGTFNAGVLARTIILASSAGSSAVSLSGITDVLGVWPASELSSGARFNVRAFGATGNGSTDDTVAINAAIAAFNTAGVGRLYFPAGTYFTATGFTTITATGIIEGDGADGYGGSTSVYGGATSTTLITCNSRTAVVFNINCKSLTIRDLGILNTAVLAPTAGAGIVNLGATGIETINYSGLMVAAFWINIDTRGGALWTMNRCKTFGGISLGMSVKNLAVADFGDWQISDCDFVTYPNQFTPSLLGVSQSGGGKITNCKFLGGNNTQLATWGEYTNGINLNYGATSDLLISNCSIESFMGQAIVVTTANNTVITNIQLLPGSAASGAAISVTGHPAAVSNIVGSYGDAGGLVNFGSPPGSDVQESNIVNASGTGAIQFTKSGGNQVTLFDYNYIPWLRPWLVGNLTAPPATLGGIAFLGRQIVTDSTVTLAAGLGNIVAGGSNNVVPVYYDGTNWRIG